MRELEKRKVSLAAELSQAASVPAVIQLHPAAAEVYWHKVVELETALNHPDICAEAGEALSALIEAVVLMPDGSTPDGLRAELHSALAVVTKEVIPGDTADGWFSAEG